MKKSPNPKTFLLLTVGTVLAGLGATYWAWSGMTEQAAVLQTLRKESENEEDVRRQLRKSREELAVIAQRLGHLEVGVSEGAYLPTMLREIETAGHRCGLDILGLRPAPAPEVKADKTDEKVKKPYREMDIELKARGNYGAVLRFVRALDAFPQVVAARAISLQPRADVGTDGKSRDLGTLEVSVNLRAFVFKEQRPKREGAGEEKTASLSGGSSYGG